MKHLRAQTSVSKGYLPFPIAVRQILGSMSTEASPKTTHSRNASLGSAVVLGADMGEDLFYRFLDPKSPKRRGRYPTIENNAVRPKALSCAPWLSCSSAPPA
mmetsp:Transcript_147797/g.255973  ORF Transcript_147797/g.255973 Transcript_147797/m.255973 type:complete len:102 (+) Transcript_147797:2-307(+)